MKRCAGDIHILSAGAPRAGILRCAEEHFQKSGVRTQIDFATSPEIEMRLKSDTSGIDLVVAPTSAFENGPVSDATLRDTRAVLGSIAVGIAVRHDADAIDLRSADAFQEALLSADAIIYNRASSGAYIEKMIDALGVRERVADRTVRTDTGRDAMEYLARGGSARAIAFGQISEIKRLEALGIRLAGPLPSGLSKTTTYAAALTRSVIINSPAHRFLGFLRSNEARLLLLETGLV